MSYMSVWMRPNEDGTPATFMDVANRVYLLLRECGDDGKWITPGLDICPHDDSFRAWLSNELSSLREHKPFFKVSSQEFDDKGTVLDIARLWLAQDQLESSDEPLPWLPPGETAESTLVAFATEIGAPPERIDREVYAMLCDLHSVEDMVRSKLFLRNTKTKLLMSYANARRTGKSRVFSTQGLKHPVVMVDKEDMTTHWDQLKITEGPWRGRTIAETGLFHDATRFKYYNFLVWPNGSCAFAGMQEEDVPDAVRAELDVVREQVNAKIASNIERANAERARRLASHDARQRELNESESAQQRARRAAAERAKHNKEERGYTPTGPSHKTPKPKHTRCANADDVTRAIRATEAEKGRHAALQHQKALDDKEEMRVQQLEAQLENRRIATKIQQGD